MPRPRKSAPAYRLHKVTGRAVVTLNGHDIYLGTHNTPESWEKYHRLLAEHAALRCGHHVDAAPPPVYLIKHLIRDFMRHAHKHYRTADGRPTSTIEVFKQSLRMLMKLYGSVPAGEFGPRKLKTVREAMIGQGLSRETINTHVRRIRQVFNFAVENEYVGGEVLHALTAVKGLRRGRSDAKEGKGVESVDETRVEPATAFMPSPVAAMVHLQLLTGMRPAEVCTLTTGQIDRTGKVWAYRPSHHKTIHHGRGRVIYFGPKSQELLASWLKLDPDAACFSPREAVRELLARKRENRVTPENCGNRPGTNRKSKPKTIAGEFYSVASYRRAINRACDEAFPVPDELVEENRKAWKSEHRFSPNQLRHTAATKLRREFGLEVAQAVLGHSSRAVTERYAEVDNAAAKAVMGKVG